MQIKENSRIFCPGKTGSGKTTFAKETLFPLYPRRIFWDIKLENNDLLTRCSLCRTPTELKLALNSHKNSILYQPKDVSTDDFNAICEIIYNQGNFTLFVDEAATVTSPSWIEPWHYQIMIRGRSRGIGCVNLTQRPRACNNALISEAEHFFIFRLQLETDVAKIKTILPKQYHKQVYGLPDFKCIYVSNMGEIKFLNATRLR